MYVCKAGCDLGMICVRAYIGIIAVFGSFGDFNYAGTCLEHWVLWDQVPPKAVHFSLKLRKKPDGIHVVLCYSDIWSLCLYCHVHVHVYE